MSRPKINPPILTRNRQTEMGVIARRRRVVAAGAERVVQAETEAAPSDWRPLFSYTANLQRWARPSLTPTPPGSRSARPSKRPGQR